ncbi:MAG: hypothetical protein CMF25_07745 [Kangiellaceae bacterium]|nr:hypothetical protein [Kangiellaceae bacterium]
MLHKLLVALIGLAFAAYPILVYFGLKFGSVAHIGWVLLGMIALRQCLLWIKSKRAERSIINTHWVYAAAALCIALGVVKNDAQYFRYYPVLISLSFLGIFGYTLWKPPSMIEKLGRLMEKDFPEEAVGYTRKVTVVWCVFFGINGLVALYTAVVSSMDTWVLYNGLIAYLLMGALFVGELAVRQLVKKQFKQDDKC